MDAVSFTVIRLLSAIVVLWVLILFRQRAGYAVQTPNAPHASFAPSIKDHRPPSQAWYASAMLLLYALFFSFAYLSLDTGVGALILFVSVQITIVTVSLFKGYRLRRVEWAGLIIALLGFISLLAPNVFQQVKAPVISLSGTLLMMLSGVAWGLYTLLGRGSTAPLMDSGYNFLRTAPVIILLVIYTASTFSSASISWQAIMLAMASGGLASGLGYAIWYSALQGLSSIQSGVLQLLVPVIAAIGGVVFADEFLSWHIVISSSVILLGVLLVHLARAKAVE